MKFILTAAFALLMIACKTNSKPASTQEEKKVDSISQVKADTADTNNCRLVIMFYSIGEGIDFDANTAFEDSIGTYSQRIGKTIDYKKTPWGREGEIDFCLKLNELTPSEQFDFIEEMRMQLKKAKWVNIFENYPCPDRGRRK